MHVIWELLITYFIAPWFIFMMTHPVLTTAIVLVSNTAMFSYVPFIIHTRSKHRGQ